MFRSDHMGWHQGGGLQVKKCVLVKPLSKDEKNKEDQYCVSQLVCEFEDLE